MTTEAQRTRPKAPPKLAPERAHAYYRKIVMETPHRDGAAILRDCPVGILVNRGYRRDTIGRVGLNDFGVWDDAGWIVHRDRPAESEAFNWNADPVRVGFNPGVGKEYAQLMPGLWPMMLGRHKDRPERARQMTIAQAGARNLGRYAADDAAKGYYTIRRVKKDNVGALQTGYYAINLHEGTKTGTGSWGCQTVHPDDWPRLHDRLYSWCREAGVDWFWIALTEDRLS